jgi:Ca2+-transporting ATPase
LQVACKGAPEAIADLCGLSAARRAVVMAEVGGMARRGLRVIAAASAVWNELPSKLPDTAHGFRFEWRGLLGFADPLRAGVPDAVAEAQAAGIRVVMLTGDHVETARAIATQAGLAHPDAVVLGSELQQLDGNALARQAAATNVFARVKPDHKLAWSKRSRRVAKWSR